MKLIQYQFLGNTLLLLVDNGRHVQVSLDENSGKILIRLKRDTLSKVQHPGIWLGTDHRSGISYVLHNHYRQGLAHIATYVDYAAGQQVSWKNDSCTNDRYTVIKKGLDQVVAGRRYNWLDYNCQVFTNSACHNRSYSEDVDKWKERIFGGLGLFLLVGLVASSMRSE